MNNEKLYALAGGINDDFVAETMKPKAARPRYLRYAAAAAAVLLVLGAAFGVVKAAGAKGNAASVLPEKYAFMADTAVPADAVLPPSQTGNGIQSGYDCYAAWYNIRSLYEQSDAVCLLTVGNWLGENNIGTYYEATINLTYKGELPGKIVIYQVGNSDWILNGSPLFTYGDKLLAGLKAWDKGPYNNAYELSGADNSFFYAASDDNGKVYLFDHDGRFSYRTGAECPELVFTNYANDSEIIEQLKSSFSAYDKAVASILEEYSESENARVERGMKSEFPLHIYSLEEIEEFFLGMD